MRTLAQPAQDDDVVEMEPVDESGPLAAGKTRVVFLALAVVAGVALLAAVLIVIFAPANALTLLVAALIVLALVVIAEIVLLLMARPRNA